MDLAVDMKGNLLGEFQADMVRLVIVHPVVVDVGSLGYHQE